MLGTPEFKFSREYLSADLYPAVIQGRIHGFTQTKNDLVDLQKDLARNIRACSTPMDPRILLLATVCLGVAIAAPMAMRDIQITFNMSGLVWRDPSKMPLYEGYQDKVWGCGRMWSLTSWKKFTLYSEGQVAGGSCVTEFLVSESGSCMNEVCVSPESLHIDKNGIEIKFENMYKNETKTLSHSDMRMQTRCFSGKSLMFMVTTDRTITLPSNDFKFKFVVYANCPGVPKDVIMKSDKDSEEFSTLAQLEAAEMMNMILGIVTAGCICVVFLIILVATYCYFRNNPDLKRHHHSEETRPLRK